MKNGIISLTILLKSEIDRKIAKLYYLQGWTQMQVGVEVGYSESTIKRKLPKLLNIIEKNSKWTLDELQGSFFYVSIKPWKERWSNERV